MMAVGRIAGAGLTAWLALAGTGSVCAQAVPPRASVAVGGVEMESTGPVPALITAEKQRKKVMLVGRTRDALVFTDGGGSGQVALNKIEEVRFDMTYDIMASLKAVRAREWIEAVRLMLPAVRPALPYLDLPNNNAARMAFEVGDYMMRAAEQRLRMGPTEENRNIATEQYKAAYSVLKYASRASWSSVALLAELKSLQCLVALSKPATAQRYIDDLDEPMVGDVAYGLYWLLKAELAAARRSYTEAMDGAVKSLCFENKDVDTFPDALLLSARCYEELQQWHRARDVYYEVARIFPFTDWSVAAIDRLKFIQGKGLTEGADTSPIENVFFGTQEEMNQIVRSFLAEVASGGWKEEAYEESEYKEQEVLQESIAADVEGGTVR